MPLVRKLKFGAVRRESHADRDLGFIPDTENPRMGFLRSLLRFGVEVFERPVAFTWPKPQIVFRRTGPARVVSTLPEGCQAGRLKTQK